MAKTLIKKIVLDLDGKEVALSVEQAKKLQGLLSEVLGMSAPVLPQPPIIIRDDRWHWDFPEPTFTWRFEPDVMTSGSSNWDGCEVSYLAELEVAKLSIIVFG